MCRQTHEWGGASEEPYDQCWGELGFGKARMGEEVEEEEEEEKGNDATRLGIDAHRALTVYDCRD